MNIYFVVFVSISIDVRIAQYYSPFLVVKDNLQTSSETSPATRPTDNETSSSDSSTTDGKFLSWVRIVSNK